MRILISNEPLAKFGTPSPNQRAIDNNNTQRERQFNIDDHLVSLVKKINDRYPTNERQL